MVEVGEHRRAGAAALGEDGVDVVTERLEKRLSALRRDELLEVRGIDVNGSALEVLGDLLSLDHEEAPGSSINSRYSGSVRRRTAIWPPLRSMSTQSSPKRSM